MLELFNIIFISGYACRTKIQIKINKNRAKKLLCVVGQVTIIQSQISVVPLNLPTEIIEKMLNVQ